MLNSALKMVRNAQEEIDINDFDAPNPSLLEKSKLRTMLLVFGPAGIVSGALLILLILLQPTQLLRAFYVSLGVFVLSAGITAVCIVRGTDLKINKAITRASR